MSGHATPAWEARIRRARCACGRPIPLSSGPDAFECAEHDDPPAPTSSRCARAGCGHSAAAHEVPWCAGVCFAPDWQTNGCTCDAFVAEADR